MTWCWFIFGNKAVCISMVQFSNSLINYNCYHCMLREQPWSRSARLVFRRSSVQLLVTVVVLGRTYNHNCSCASYKSLVTPLTPLLHITPLPFTKKTFCISHRELGQYQKVAQSLYWSTPWNISRRVIIIICSVLLPQCE